MTQSNRQPACRHAAISPVCPGPGWTNRPAADEPLCVGDLVRITGGRLRLASLPPLAGEFEPVRRIVTEMSDVAEGDVYWARPAARGVAAECVEEAYARGALGVVVVGRRVEPWAGRFVLEVNDSEQKLVDLAARCGREGPAGTVVLAPLSPRPARRAG